MNFFISIACSKIICKRFPEIEIKEKSQQILLRFSQFFYRKRFLKKLVNPLEKSSQIGYNMSNHLS